MVNGTRESELRTRFWPMRLTYSDDFRIGDQLRALLHLFGEVVAHRDLPLDGIEVHSDSNISVPNQGDVVLRRLGRSLSDCWCRRWRRVALRKRLWLRLRLNESAGSGTRSPSASIWAAVGIEPDIIGRQASACDPAGVRLRHRQPTGRNRAGRSRAHSSGRRELRRINSAVAQNQS